MDLFGFVLRAILSFFENVYIKFESAYIGFWNADINSITYYAVRFQMANVEKTDQLWR